MTMHTLKRARHQLQVEQARLIREGKAHFPDEDEHASEQGAAMAPKERRGGGAQLALQEADLSSLADLAEAGLSDGEQSEQELEDEEEPDAFKDMPEMAPTSRWSSQERSGPQPSDRSYASAQFSQRV